MASKFKHKQRSSRSHQVNSIPANRFYAYAEKVRQAKAARQLFAESKEVEAEVVE